MGISAPTPLTESHNTAAFNCGQDSLNEWLQKRAIKNEKNGASRTFVVCDANTVVGYYSLAVGAVVREEASGKVRRNMPEPIPVMILARQAVEKQRQGKHIGPGLLKDAIQRTLIVAEHAGIRALLVHAISDKAKRFYLSAGFHESPLNDMTLMITVEEARKALIQAEQT